MKVNEVRNKAIGLGIDPADMIKKDMILAIQENEGHDTCYVTNDKTCVYTDCCFWSDCIAEYNRKNGPAGGKRASGKKKTSGTASSETKSVASAGRTVGDRKQRGGQSSAKRRSRSSKKVSSKEPGSSAASASAKSRSGKGAKK